jgi:hypothetical protein
MREHDVSAWSSWLKAARKSCLHHFVVQLQRDEAAERVHATLEHEAIGRSHSSIEADQTPDVWASETRLATDPRVVRSLIDSCCSVP